MEFRFDFRRMFGAAADGLFGLALTQTSTFHGAARPILQGHAGGDIAKAQALALQGLHTYLHVIKRRADRFQECFNDDTPYADLRVPCGRKWTTPVGTAPGVDPHADGLEPLSYLYGLQMPGPVSLRPQPCAEMPYQEDTRREDLYVPPTYASQGVDYMCGRLRAFRQRDGTAVVLPALVGDCRADADVDDLLGELQQMVAALAPDVDGFVWMPSLAGWTGIWNPHVFLRAAERMSVVARDRLLLVEMPAVETRPPLDMTNWLELVGAFVDGGGDGIVAVGGREVLRDQVPIPACWPFDSAIQCGASLGACRQTAIEAARHAFPSIFIAACGGFHQRDEAFRACEFANVIVENEAFTRFGPGIAPQFLHKLILRLRYLVRSGQIASPELWAFQQTRWKQLVEPSATTEYLEQ